MANDTTNNGYKNTHFPGDVSVSRNVNIGGTLTQQGSAHIKGSVKIDGWLDAKNIKGDLVNKGLFENKERLKKALPKPKSGWYALVLDHSDDKAVFKPKIYLAKSGEWCSTEQYFDGIYIDYDYYDEKLKSLGYTFLDDATPTTKPQPITTDSKVFYIATEEGEYSNFGLGNISELSIIKSDGGTWKTEGLGVPLNLFESVLKSSQTYYTTDNDAGIMSNFNQSTNESSVISTSGLGYWGVIANFNKPITIHSALSVATFSSMPKVGAQDLRYIRPNGSTIILSPEENENYILITIDSKFKAIIVETENLDKRITNIEESLASYTNLAPDLRNGIYKLVNSGLVFASSDSYKTIQVDVNSGDTYLYRAVLAETSDIAAVCFTNDNSEIIAPLYRVSTANKGNIAKGVVKVPEGVTKITFTTTVNDDNPIFAKIDGLLNVQEELNKIQKNIDNYEPILDVIDVKSKNLYNGKYIDALINTGGGIQYIDNYATTELIPILPNHYYYLSGRNKTTTTSIRCVDAEGKSLKVLAAATGEEYSQYYYMPNATATGAQSNGQFKTPNDAVAVQFIIKSPNTNSDAFNNVMLEDVGVEYDPTFEPSPYEPYELKAFIKEDALPEEVIENITGQNKRKAPRILLIGSSHGMNTISQVPWMFYRNGYDEVYVGNVYLGSFMIQELAQRIALGQSLSYQAFKDGAWGKDRGNLVMNDLLNKEWDVIILQRSANTCQKWGVAESTSFGYVVDYITSYVKETKLKTPRILFNSGFSDGKANTTEQIMSTALQCKDEYGVEIIPNAYALANARNTWMKSIGTTGYLCYDKQHLDYGIGCWLAGATLYEAVMRPLGESIECVSGYGTQQEQYVFTTAANAENYTEPTEKMIRVAKDCVLAAFNANELNTELETKYKYKNQVKVFPGWANIEGPDANTKCIPDNGAYSITFSIWSGSYIDDTKAQPVIVKMGDADITDTAYTVNSDNRGGTISISNVTDDIVVIIQTTRDDPNNHPA